MYIVNSYRVPVKVGILLGGAVRISTMKFGSPNIPGSIPWGTHKLIYILMTDLERYYEAKEAYYNGEPIMTDLEFDELERSLGLENKSEIGARHNPSYTVQHPFIMGSLSKIQIKENQNGAVIWNDYFTELRRYIKDSNIPCIVSPKYDGCSFEAVVVNGMINSISSRGDGEYGKNLYSHLLLKVQPTVDDLIPQIGNDFVIRGEVLIDKKTFEAKYNDFVNPRSFVSGVLNRDFCDDEKFIEMMFDLSVVVYDIRIDKGGYYEDHDFRFYKFENKPSFYESQVIMDSDDFSKLYKKFDTYRSECEFALDGFVIKPIDSFRINNLTEHRPKDCVAIKFIPMLEETVVEEIIWSTRKTNELIPVIKVRPVIMDGKEVSRASAHNYGYLIDNKISVGTKVILSLAGDIIPFIYKVTDSSDFDVHKLCLPHNIETTIDGCHLNKVLSKQEITKKRFMNSVSAMNIPNMGPSVTEKLYDYLSGNDLAEEYGDFFLIEQKETPENILLVNMDDVEIGISGKTGTSVRKAFEKIIKTLTLKDIILSLAIEDCGPKIAEQIEKQLLTGDADFSHMAEKAYKWVFDENSDEYNRVINILMKLNMSINDFKDKFIKETEKSSNQIPVILTGEPNNYASKGEFLQCNPQYRLTGSWKEVKIVFTNSLDSNTGKMKKAREKNIEIQLY